MLPMGEVDEPLPGWLAWEEFGGWVPVELPPDVCVAPPPVVGLAVTPDADPPESALEEGVELAAPVLVCATEPPTVARVDAPGDCVGLGPTVPSLLLDAAVDWYACERISDVRCQVGARCTHLAPAVWECLSWSWS